MGRFHLPGAAVWGGGVGGGAIAWADTPGVTDVASKDYTGAVAAGGHLALSISADRKTLRVDNALQNTLDSQAQKALTQVPGWLQHQLREVFRGLPASDQQRWARAILDAPEKTRDEVGFLIAHLSKEDRAVATPAMVSSNAALIYDVDPDLMYADLVEKGTYGKDKDYYTTVKYHVLDGGKAATFELPRELYYWWVVHPFLDMEVYRTIDPNTGQAAAPPTGITWREFFLAKKDATLTPRKHHVMSSPNKIGDRELAAYRFGTPRAYASLGASEVGTNELIRAGSSNEPVLIHHSPGGGGVGTSKPNPDGVYFYTTLPLEKAAAAGDTGLLENLLLAGSKQGTLRDRIPVVHGTCYAGRTMESRQVAVVRDRLPFGLATDPNETLLTKNSRSYKVLTSTALEALITGGKLHSAAKPLVTYSYNKIVVPSDQPRALYVLLNKYRTQLEAYVKQGGILQVHGATRAADDWCDLTLPGAIKCKASSSSGALDQLKEYGYPMLRDVMKGVQYLWTGVRRCSRHDKQETCHKLKGDRRIADCPDAIDRVGWWSGQMTHRSVSEYSVLNDLGTASNCPSTASRSIHPQRIVANKFGNCGEIQDVVGAASRTVLVPSLLTMSVEDHVWNEFYAGNDQWYPYDTGWSDTSMRIGNWGVSGDGDAGGGKENAVMVGWRGDGKAINLLGRYEAVFADNKIDYEYTRWLTVTVKVLDKNRLPVDGAVVTLLTEWFYSSTRAVKAISGVTGRDGSVVFKVGDKRNFYVNIQSALGSYPRSLSSGYFPAMAEFKPLVLKSEAVPDAKISKEFVLSGRDDAGAAYTALTVPAGTLKALARPARDAVHHRLVLDLKLLAEHQPGYNTLNSRSYLETVSPGQADLYLVDRANYDKLKAGAPFEAAEIKTGVDALSALTVDLPQDNKEYLAVVSNARRSTFLQLVQASAQLKRVDPAAQPDPGPEAEGCSCSLDASPSAGARWPLSGPRLLAGLALVMVSLSRRRRRRTREG